ncbi:MULTISPECIES: hypothetical protein [Microbacterium]|uniref:Uncharacterized protein n=1 Tax=Microbacterium wangchenii TaxID=2541726 RepID=A0ABX5STF6_9MICO|nr:MULTISPECIES: hypothetical protein [Microbacterium]MCK6065078.1 hypothetical protein [Microbacterium sp. EYE_512]QBR88540.1 hypothetical protein E4K62_07485 [Microbacterium wangchenii]TXK20266.1 hypothetical protein FVP99_01100 [Microbacterium wangchenii]
MKSRITAVVVASLLLTGCAAPPSPSPSPTAASAASTPSPTPTPTAAPVVVMTLDGFADPTGGTGASFERCEEVVTFVGGLVGAAPVVTDIEDPWGNGTSWGTRYEWDGVAVSDFPEMGASVWVRSAFVGGHRLETAEGIAVGSTRAEAVAAGAWDIWDEDGDGTAEHLGIGSQEVPGTTSLSNPGAVGVEFVVLVLDGDVVTELQAPANDFSDI